MTNRIVLPDEGLPDLVSYLLGRSPFPITPWYLILYQAPVDPTHATTWSMLTECTFAGYSRVTLDPTLWSVPVATNGTGISRWGTSPVSWTNTGPSQNVAGWAFIKPGSTHLVYMIQEQDPTITLLNAQTLPFWPTFGETTDTCTP